MPSARKQTLEQRRVFLRAVFEKRAGVSLFDRIEEATVAFREPGDRRTDVQLMEFPRSKMRVGERVAV